VRKHVAVLAAAFLALTAPRAMATGTLDKNTATANSDVALTLNVSVDDLGAYDERVVLQVPSGFRVLACSPSGDFSCTKSATAVTWKRTAPGTPVALASDQFSFRLHTIDRAGTYAFAVHQVYSDNTTADSSPKLSVTAGAARSVSTTTVAKAVPVVRSASVAPTRAARAAPSTSEPAWLTDSDLAAPTAVELGRELPARNPRPMVIAGLIATAAACGVFWLRRRATPAR
jgi:uncharacterized protein YcnI